ncbi:LysR substrate-binding domain-containing protein [Paraherbaspirillum soli]|uniref:LysR substrate-binding domain-containing protein n=1 Tax=Paraherbaspirillum soli TaxID=631222 RepID=A0ABW0M713_9BURK
MSQRLPPLLALRAFEATARHMSVKHAAAELSVTATAVSHQLRQLEEALQAKLFERLPRRLVLTAQGHILYPALREGFDAFEQGVARIRAGQLRQVVTLSVTLVLAARWLVPHVASFRAACPGLDLRIHASDEAVDLAAREADLAIRYGAGKWPGLAAEHLMQENFAPVCSPALKLKDAADLPRHPLIHFAWQKSFRNPATWQRWAKQAQLPALEKLDAAAGLFFSDGSHAIQATLAGQGVAMMGLALIDAELRSGALVQPFGPVLDAGSYYVVCDEARQHEPQLQLVRQWLHGLRAVAA